MMLLNERNMNVFFQKLLLKKRFCGEMNIRICRHTTRRAIVTFVAPQLSVFPAFKENSREFHSRLHLLLVKVLAVYQAVSFPRTDDCVNINSPRQRDFG